MVERSAIADGNGLIVSRKARWTAAAVGVLCSAATFTMLTWPRYQPGSWELPPPAWWQLEWLASLGILLSLPPSWVIYRFHGFFAANEVLRLPAVALLIVLEIALLCVAAYATVATLGRMRNRRRA
jgi:hypothetical protein